MKNYNEIVIQVNEVHKMLRNNTVLGPDGKVLTLFSDTGSSSMDSCSSQKAVLSDNEDSLICAICKFPGTIQNFNQLPSFSSRQFEV